MYRLSVRTRNNWQIEKYVMLRVLAQSQDVWLFVLGSRKRHVGLLVCPIRSECSPVFFLQQGEIR